RALRHLRPRSERQALPTEARHGRHRAARGPRPPPRSQVRSGEGAHHLGACGRGRKAAAAGEGRGDRAGTRSQGTRSVRARLDYNTPRSGPMKRLTLLATLVLSSVTVSALANADTPAIPQTMRAAAFDHGGGPEVLSIHTLPVPTPSAGEVLIAVHASGVAVWELGSREHPNPHVRFPSVLGSDGSGTIVALGPDVHGFKVGDQVYGTGNGFYAEYVKTRADRIAHIPKG